MLDLDEKRKQIKKKRKELGLTQKELAEESRLSQSFIAKVESKALKPSYKPSYENIKRIEEILHKYEEEVEGVAKDIMNSPVEGVAKDNGITKAIKIMRKNDFSQVPVFDENVPVGSITERNIMDAQEKYDKEELKAMKSGEIMGDCFPIVNPETSKKTVRNVLKHEKAVLIKKEKEVVGIVDRADYLKL